MLLTVSQVAEKIGSPPSTVKYWEARGIIPAAIRYGTRRDRRWQEEDIIRFLAERDGQGSHPTAPPPASCAEPAHSECPPQSRDSSGKPELS